MSYDITQVAPALHKLKSHAKYLSDTFPISYCQAQNILGMSLGFSTWHKLTIALQQSDDWSTTSKLISHFPTSNSVAHKLRSKILHDIRNDHDNGSIEIMRLCLLPYTMSYAVAKLRFDWLLNDEIDIIALHMYQDELNEDVPTHTFDEAVISWDDNILTRLSHAKASGRKSYKAHLHDYRRFFRTYYEVEFHSDEVLILIREMDLLFPMIEKRFTRTEAVCEKPWYYLYVTGYIQYLISCLKEGGYKGCIIIHRINEQNIIDSKSPQILKSHPIMVTSILKSLGAQESKVLPNQSDHDLRTGLLLSF